MSKRKTEDYVVEVSDVFESSGDWLEDILEALNDRGIQAYVYKKVDTHGYTSREKYLAYHDAYNKKRPNRQKAKLTEKEKLLLEQKRREKYLAYQHAYNKQRPNRTKEKQHG